VLELTDANGGTGAAELMKGVDAALQPLLASGRYTKSGDLTVRAGHGSRRRRPCAALASWDQCVLVTDDSLSTAVVADLKAAGVPARHVAVAGQGATTQSLVDILEGYQCMAAYEPVSAEAQAAAAVALYLRAGRPVPRGLINATTTGVGAATLPRSCSPRSRDGPQHRRDGCRRRRLGRPALQRLAGSHLQKGRHHSLRGIDHPLQGCHARWHRRSERARPDRRAPRSSCYSPVADQESTLTAASRTSAVAIWCRPC